MLEDQIGLLHQLIEANAKQNKSRLQILQLQTTSKVFAQHMSYKRPKEEPKAPVTHMIAKSPFVFKRMRVRGGTPAHTSVRICRTWASLGL